MWYLLNCARALHLIDFELEGTSRNLIKTPRLTALAESLVAQATPEVSQ